MEINVALSEPEVQVIVQGLQEKSELIEKLIQKLNGGQPARRRRRGPNKADVGATSSTAPGKLAPVPATRTRRKRRTRAEIEADEAAKQRAKQDRIQKELEDEKDPDLKALRDAEAG